MEFVRKPVHPSYLDAKELTRLMRAKNGLVNEETPKEEKKCPKRTSLLAIVDFVNAHLESVKDQTKMCTDYKEFEDAVKDFDISKFNKYASENNFFEDDDDEDYEGEHTQGRRSTLDRILFTLKVLMIRDMLVKNTPSKTQKNSICDHLATFPRMTPSRRKVNIDLILPRPKPLANSSRGSSILISDDNFDPSSDERQSKVKAQNLEVIKAHQSKSVSFAEGRKVMRPEDESRSDKTTVVQMIRSIFRKSRRKK